MLHNLLLLAVFWLGSVSPQYIKTAVPVDESLLDPLEATLRSSQHFQYYNLPESQFDEESQFYPRLDGEQDLHRIRRTILSADQGRNDVRRDETAEPVWLPNLVDTDKTTYVRSDSKSPIVVQEFTGTIERNISTDPIKNLFTALEKRSFSPWGGKRDGKPLFENMWTWRRPDSVKEPSMPKSAKRVRFSPWGGKKRSAPLIYKAGSKGSKIILSTAPEISRFVSNYIPNENSINLAGFQIQTLDKRHPIRVLALSTTLDKDKREAAPFHLFEALPKTFRLGHPYSDVNLKKDGKRKVKFSAWGGKRAPPIIGPIWTPTSQFDKDTTLDALLLVRDSKKILEAKAL